MWSKVTIKEETKKRIKGEIMTELLRVRPKFKYMNLTYDKILNEVFDSWIKI